MVLREFGEPTRARKVSGPGQRIPNRSGNLLFESELAKERFPQKCVNRFAARDRELNNDEEEFFSAEADVEPTFTANRGDVRSDLRTVFFRGA
eukprot:6122445-Amphidinium_carterae.1